MTIKTIPDTILCDDTLPKKGVDLKVWYEDRDGTRWYFVDRAYRDGSGKPRHFRRKTDDSNQHLKNQLEAQSITGDECSLTSLKFGKCVELYLSERGYGGFNKACYDRAKKELGRLYPDKQSFAAEYSRYAAHLEASDLAINTANNYKIVVRSICNFAYLTSRAGRTTVRDWRVQKGNERNRVLSQGEELSLINYLTEIDSHILEAVKFSLKNPIRKSDLFNLKRKNLQMDGSRWVIKFQAQKTRKKVRITILPNIDLNFVRYAHSLPPDCPWLFPMLIEKGGIVTWRKIDSPRRHFNYVLSKCEIYDFNWHDLKHCAETYMLRQGFNYEMLQKLGIQTSPKTQHIYDNRNQLTIISDVLGSQSGSQRSHNVAPQRDMAAC
jgi:integrase